jgi:hypothetical protein
MQASVLYLPQQSEAKKKLKAQEIVSVITTNMWRALLHYAYFQDFVHPNIQNVCESESFNL